MTYSIICDTLIDEVELAMDNALNAIRATIERLKVEHPEHAEALDNISYDEFLHARPGTSDTRYAVAEALEGAGITEE